VTCMWAKWVREVKAFEQIILLSKYTDA